MLSNSKCIRWNQTSDNEQPRTQNLICFLPSFLSIFKAIRTVVRISFIHLWIFQQNVFPYCAVELCESLVYVYVYWLLEGNPECFCEIKSNRIKVISSPNLRNWRKKYVWTRARSRARATIVIIIRFFPQSFDDLQMKLNKMFAFRLRNEWITHMLCSALRVGFWAHVHFLYY